MAIPRMAGLAVFLVLFVAGTVLAPVPALAENFATLSQQGWSCNSFTMRCTNTDGRTADCGGGRPSSDPNQCHITTPASSSGGGATAPTTPATGGSDTAAAGGSATTDAAGPAQSAQSDTADDGGWFGQAAKVFGGITLGAVLAPVAILMWVMFKIGSLLLGLAGILFNWTVGALVFQFAKFLGNSPGMLVGWGVLRDFGNIGLIFGFVFMGISTILDLHSYPWKKALPSLVIFAVLLNFSLFAAEAVVDSTNVLAAVLYDNAYDSGTCGSAGSLNCMVDNGIAGHLLTKLHISGVFDGGGGDNLGSGIVRQFTDPVANILRFVGLALVTTIAAVVLFAGTIMLISRAVVLAFLMVTSPIGFAGMAIPGLHKLAEDWWDKLLKQAFFAPVFILLLLVSLKMTDGLDQLVGTTGLAHAFSTTNTETTGILLMFALIIGFMIGSLMLATRFGIYGADFATSMAGKAVYGTMGFIGRNTVGAYAINRAEGLVKKGAFRTPLGRLRYGAYKWVAGGNFDGRSSSIGKSLAGVANVDIGKAQHGGAEHAMHEERDKFKKLAEEAKNTPQEEVQLERAKIAVAAEERTNASLTTQQVAAGNALIQQQVKVDQGEAGLKALQEQGTASQAAIQAQIAQLQKDKETITSSQEAMGNEAMLEALTRKAEEDRVANETRERQAEEQLRLDRKALADQKAGKAGLDVQVRESGQRLAQRRSEQTDLKKKLDPKVLFAKALEAEIRRASDVPIIGQRLLKNSILAKGAEHAAHSIVEFSEKDATAQGFDRMIRAIKDGSAATAKASAGVKHELESEFDQLHGKQSDSLVSPDHGAGH